MDNHVHIVWKPTALYALKHTQLSFLKFTEQRIKRDLQENHPQVLKHFLVELKDRDYQFWQRNALCVDLLSEEIIEEKLNYIHSNPVKAQLMDKEESYRFTSANFYKDLGDEFEFLSNYR